MTTEIEPRILEENRANRARAEEYHRELVKYYTSKEWKVIAKETERRAQLRRDALAKLSAEEREVLGL